MPSMWFWAHVRMLPKVETQVAYQEMNAALATNGRAMDDAGRRQYLRELDEAEHGKRKAERITPSMAKHMGIRLVPPDEGKEVSE